MLVRSAWFAEMPFPRRYPRCNRGRGLCNISQPASRPSVIWAVSGDCDTASDAVVTQWPESKTSSRSLPTDCGLRALHWSGRFAVTMRRTSMPSLQGLGSCYLKLTSGHRFCSFYIARARQRVPRLVSTCWSGSRPSWPLHILSARRLLAHLVDKQSRPVFDSLALCGVHCRARHGVRGPIGGRQIDPGGLGAGRP